MKPQSVLWLPLTVSEMLQWKSAVWVCDEKSNKGNHATIQASIKKNPKNNNPEFLVKHFIFKIFKCSCVYVMNSAQLKN